MGGRSIGGRSMGGSMGGRSIGGRPITTSPPPGGRSTSIGGRPGRTASGGSTRSRPSSMPRERPVTRTTTSFGSVAAVRRTRSPAIVRSTNSTPSPPPTSLPSTKPDAGAGPVVATARSCSRGSTCRPATTKTSPLARTRSAWREVISPTARRSAFNVSRCSGGGGGGGGSADGGSTPAGTKSVGSTAIDPAASLSTKRAATAAASGRSAVALRTNRPVGASSRRSAGSTVVSGSEVGAIAARTVASPSGARPDSGAAYVSARAGARRAIERRWSRVDAWIDSSARESSALAASTEPTCSQHAVIRSSCSRRTTSAPRPAATRVLGSRFSSRNHPVAVPRPKRLIAHAP